ncbi:hypothetical protein ACHAXS_004321 [Conticribra weissflogii]
MFRTISSFGIFGSEVWERCLIFERNQKSWDSKCAISFLYMKMRNFNQINIANAIRELSKVLDGAIMAVYKEMNQIMKYLLDTGYLELRIKPTQGSEQPWELIFFSNRDHTRDPSSR